MLHLRQTTNQWTWCHIPEGLDIHRHHSKQLESHTDQTKITNSVRISK